MNSKSKKISVIVPAFNEGPSIQKTLKVLTNYLCKKDFESEVIIVNDGSKDDTVVKAKKFQCTNVRVVTYGMNMGKGFALRTGFEHSTGDIIAFFDAGLDYDPSHIDFFLKYMEKYDADVVIGSKRHPQSKVNYPLKRKIISSFAQLIVKILFNLNIRDTQAGLKVFKREVLEKVVPRALVRRYMIDVELLSIAHYYGFKIIEAPIELNFNFKTTSVTAKALWWCGIDVLSIFYRLRILKFYQKSEKERERILRKRRK
ncbi:MAG: dolichol-phosphate mannosyltransferase [uncultured bacterium]|nr:MAG: dolichol-phosphate mannosyltransferase [uncultured bacterium]